MPSAACSPAPPPEVLVKERRERRRISACICPCVPARRPQKLEAHVQSATATTPPLFDSVQLCEPRQQRHHSHRRLRQPDREQTFTAPSQPGMQRKNQVCVRMPLRLRSSPVSSSVEVLNCSLATRFSPGVVNQLVNHGSTVCPAPPPKLTSSIATTTRFSTVPHSNHGFRNRHHSIGVRWWNLGTVAPAASHGVNRRLCYPWPLDSLDHRTDDRYHPPSRPDFATPHLGLLGFRLATSTSPRPPAQVNERTNSSSSTAKFHHAGLARSNS